MHRAAQVAELDASKDKVVAHYAAQERQAAEEAQLRADANSWQRLQALGTSDLVRAAMETDTPYGQVRLLHAVEGEFDQPTQILRQLVNALILTVQEH